MSRRTAVALGLVLVMAGIVIIAGEFLDVLGIDRCLDAGGSYDNLKQTCDLSQSHPAPAGLSRGVGYVIGGVIAIAAGLGLLMRSRRLR